MNKIELKFGRPCIAWDYNGIEKPGIYLHEESGVYCVHLNDHRVYWFCNVKPDPNGQPMNGDEVDGYADKSKKLGHGRYIGLMADGRHIIETERGGFIYCEHVRHPQPSKREELEKLLDRYSCYKSFDSKCLADQIDKIYAEDL